MSVDHEFLLSHSIRTLHAAACGCTSALVSRRRPLSGVLIDRFAQSPSKEDPALYRRSLEQSSKKWLRQLKSMGLPESIMRDAQEEAPQLVESKLKARTAFTWP